MILTFRRQATARELLEIDWTYPVYQPEQKKVAEGGTRAEFRRTALPRAKALEEIHADDRRPLLVVRECGFCKGTDDALLSRRLDNEKTILLTRWFHCVKLTNDVLEEDHPFRKLFPERDPPHLFLSRFDGTGIVELNGQQTQSELWDAMQGLISSEYRGRADRAVKGMLRCLDEFDAVDSRRTEVKRQIEEEIDENGPKASRLRGLRRKLAGLDLRYAQVEKRWKQLEDLELKAEGSERPRTRRRSRRSDRADRDPVRNPSP